MSSFGHVRDMMVRYAANRELLKAKRHRHFRGTTSHTIREDKNLKRVEKNDTEMWERVKKRIRKDKKREKWLWVVVSIAVVSVLALLMRELC